jgi:hypothetical protein
MVRRADGELIALGRIGPRIAVRARRAGGEVELLVLVRVAEADLRGDGRAGGVA